VLAFELWQVKSGTIFDNVLLGDDLDEAFKAAEGTYKELVDAEKKAKETADEAKKAEEDAAAAAAADDDADEPDYSAEDDEEEPSKDEL
jgi:calreticulin